MVIVFQAKGLPSEEVIRLEEGLKRSLECLEGREQRGSGASDGLRDMQGPDYVAMVKILPFIPKTMEKSLKGNDKMVRILYPRDQLNIA